MRTDALILSTHPSREKDLMVRCYTEQSGLVTAIARGALREGSIQGMHLNQGNLVRFDLVSAHGMPLITSTTALQVYSDIKHSVRRQAAAWAILESVGALVLAPEPEPDLWSELGHRMKELNECDVVDVMGVVRNSQRAMLMILGYSPRMNECGICGSAPNGRHSFSVQLGSLVCMRCSGRGWQGLPITEEDRQWLAGQEIAAPCTRTAERAPTERLMEYVAGRSFRSLDLLFSALRA